MNFPEQIKTFRMAMCLAILLASMVASGCCQNRKASSRMPAPVQMSIYKMMASEVTTVALERSKQITDLPLPPEYDLTDGDILDNKGGKPASIQDVKDGHKFILSPKAKIKLGVQKLTLYRGKSMFEFRKTNGEFKIHMPNAVLGIRGTKFLVDIKDDGRAIVQMFEGKLAIEKNGHEVLIQGQEIAEIDSTPIQGENGATTPQTTDSGIKVIPADQQTPDFLKEFQNNDGSAIQTF